MPKRVQVLFDGLPLDVASELIGLDLYKAPVPDVDPDLMQKFGAQVRTWSLTTNVEETKMQRDITVSITMNAKDKKGGDAKVILTATEDAIELTIDSKFRTVSIPTTEMYEAVATLRAMGGGNKAEKPTFQPGDADA